MGWRQGAKRLSSRPASTGGNPEKYTVRIEPDQLGSDVRSRNAVALSIGNDRAVIIENDAADRRSSPVPASFLDWNSVASGKNVPVPSDSQVLRFIKNIHQSHSPSHQHSPPPNLH